MLLPHNNYYVNPPEKDLLTRTLNTTTRNESYMNPAKKGENAAAAQSVGTTHTQHYFNSTRKGNSAVTLR